MKGENKLLTFKIEIPKLNVTQSKIWFDIKKIINENKGSLALEQVINKPKSRTFTHAQVKARLTLLENKSNLICNLNNNIMIYLSRSR